MGCLLSTPVDAGGKRKPGSIGEVAVFVPGIRIPKTVDFSRSLSNMLSKRYVERLSSMRMRIAVLAAQEAPQAIKPKTKTATQHGGSTLSDLLQALEDYLPILLGLVKDGRQLVDKVSFVWINQEGDAEETVMANAWYELLSVLHLMAMLCLSEANLLLLPKTSGEGYVLKLAEECRRKSIDILLKAAGYLDCALQHVLPRIPPELRSNLPLDLDARVLRALCLQALGQAVDIQLGLAIDSPKATLAVKRRLACEMVKYWHQAHENVLQPHFTDGWGKKHQHFVKWKYAEAKAAAYYYHGLILDEGNTEKSHGMAIAALQAAQCFFMESKKASAAFNSMSPTSRTPPIWGSMKYLSEKISKDVSNKVPVSCSHERILEAAPPLPDFSLALKPDDYRLPPVDPLWNEEDDDQSSGQKT